jgi:hypothetical protein
MEMKSVYSNLFLKLNSTERFKLNLIKFADGDLVSGLSQFLLLPQLPHKMTLALKVAKRD